MKRSATGKGCKTEADLLKMATAETCLPFKSGHPETGFSPKNAVIEENIALKFFAGKIGPIGKHDPLKVKVISCLHIDFKKLFEDFVEQLEVFHFIAAVQDTERFVRVGYNMKLAFMPGVGMPVGTALVSAI